MKAKDYNTARESWGKTQEAMCNVLNVSPRTAQNYALKGCTGPAARLMLALQKMPAKLRNEFLEMKGN